MYGHEYFGDTKPLKKVQEIEFTFRQRALNVFHTDVILVCSNSYELLLEIIE